MKKLILIAALLAVAVSVWIAATNANTTATVETTAAAVAELPGLKVGDKAPDFKLKNIDGTMVSLADYKDAKGYIVIFTCNTCPYAVAYEDRIQALHAKYSQKGYPVVAIQPNDPEVQPGDALDKMKQRAEEKGFTFAYLLDEGQKIYPVYGASRTPEVYLLDTDLTVRYTGAIDDNYQDAEAVKVNYVKAAIKAMEAGQQPDPSFTKAIGCTIKTKKK
ncbi:MAG TPA: thioredoxin family protein [Saprospiraceae bacterium]|nr:thioredoxin family protein [Saprospiraceae bacterium]HMP26131.1 thioredoxin family protein [Saprospiraceae bacterium]